MSKKDKETKKYVLVETVQMHRMRYIIELDKEDPAEWALDTVTMEEAKELSQTDLGETIVSHRVLPGGLKEAIVMAKTDEPDVAGKWDDDLIIKNHITLKKQETTDE